MNKLLLLLLLVTSICHAEGLKIGQTITVTYKVEGSGFATVQKNTGSPAFRLMIQRGNDMTSQFGRYWSSDYVILSGVAESRKPAVELIVNRESSGSSDPPAQNLLSAESTKDQLPKGSVVNNSFGTQTLTRKRGDAQCTVPFTGGVTFTNHVRDVFQVTHLGMAAMKVQSSIAATKTFSVKIDPATWTDVYGAKGSEHLDEFKKTLAECGHVGITFGGTTGGYGHGCVGKGTFTLVDWSVK